MELSSSGVLIVLLLLPVCFCSEFVAVDAIDTITASQSLRYPETITSSDSAFKLGFFSSVNSTNRYVGIWYNDKSEAVIWVANRNRPLKDASRVVTISEDGNLVVLNGEKEVLWSSNVLNPVTNASAQVLGSGNLVLNNNTSGSIWESFGQPTDTLMRRMRLSTDTKTDKKDMKVVVIVSVVVGVVAIAICTFFLWWWMEKRKAMKEKSKMPQLQDLPVFNFEKLAIATNNVNLTNKLGQGGFGPVYKGVLQDRQEIAVKRLSKASGQEDQDYLDTLVSSPTLDHPYYWSRKKQLAVMDPRSRSIAVTLVLVLSCFYSNLGSALDTITSSRLIRDNETIISSGSAFELGFFSPVNSSNRYVGIWFNDRSETVIWVANRNKPLKDASGVLKISEDGNLVVLNGQNEVLWSSNVSKPLTNATAQLLDSGNLVLFDSTNGISIWESFQDPTNTILSGMKLSTNKRTGQKVQLTSWKNPSDPSPGSYTHGIESSNIPEAFTWNDSQVYWRTGPWNGQNFIGVNGIDRYTYSNDGFQLLADTQADAVSFTYSFLNLSMFFSLSSQGNIEGRYWNEGKNNWEVNFQSLQTECDVYGLCGAFGNCNPKKNPICSCLRGFEPKNIEEWNSGNWTSGCVRKRLLQCEKMNQTGDKVENDGFLKLETMKLPVFAARSFVTIEKCRELCLNNCSCIAYAYEAGIGCMTWTRSLIDLQKFSIGGADLYIRLAHSELEKKDNKVVVIVPVAAGTTCAICIFFVCKWLTKRKGKVLYLYRDDACPGENLNEVELQDIPLFDFEKLATATNNFHLTNKLGQGGFGPVYKGDLQDGKEIAVKRLSKASGQGLEEFKNEVLVISKLQHRNLVRLLGYCIDREEKMLIYEYMPNKSLDALLFDPLKQELLDWRKRFNIIEGISRGLLYLHRDSRLRIIHRDLKPSNILLDKELNPKISDFGMARIFGGNEDQANTIRVVGTYGYMSPEYVMEGRFSEKSDVFSFGVLLLEIVSGRRNMGVYHDAESLSLLGYALKLWKENNIVALIDPVISDPCFQSEISRCIHVGLLCVQEFVKDRPTMSTVISMLNSEIVDLPTPKQLAFTERRNFEEESSEQSQKRCSINHVTVTIVTEGR